MGSVVLKFLVGGLAGLATWAVCEPMAPGLNRGDAWGRWEQILMLTLGMLVGGSVSALSGYQRGGKRHTLVGLAVGGVLGAVGAMLGYGLGGGLVQAIYGPGVFVTGNLALRIYARTLVFTFIGACTGAAVGGSTGSPKRALQGLIGGALGGAAGGMTFDLIAVVFGNAILAAQGQQSGEVGQVSRAVAITFVGAMIGLFIGLVERIARSAWLRLSLGRNEGKEWSIDGAQTFIGRSEGAQVPLFGDANVAPVHAVLERHGADYVLRDAGSPLGTFVNGQRIASVALAPGSIIQIGSFQLEFLMRNRPAPQRGPEQYPGMAYPLGGPQSYGAPQQPYASGQGAPVAPQPQAYPPNPAPAPVHPAAGNPTMAYPSPASNPTMAYAASPVGAPTLVALDGPLAGQRFPIGAPIEVGRESASVPMGYDANASRRHAAFAAGPGGVTLTDLGSKNGTFVNGQRVQTATLRPGDVVRIGNTQFRLE